MDPVAPLAAAGGGEGGTSSAGAAASIAARRRGGIGRTGSGGARRRAWGQRSSAGSRPRRGPDDGLGSQLPLSLGEEVSGPEDVQAAASAVEIEGHGNPVRGEQRRAALPSRVLAQRSPDRRA